MIKTAKLLMAALGILATVSCSNEEDITSLSQNEVYFFYQESCPHCHEAAKYIKENHANAKIKSFDIKMPGNLRLFAKSVKEYDITSPAGTPLICFGKHYIMGWGDEDKEKLDYLIKPYIQETKN